MSLPMVEKIKILLFSYILWAAISLLSGQLRQKDKSHFDQSNYSNDLEDDELLEDEDDEELDNDYFD